MKAPQRTEKSVDQDEAELAARAAWLYHVGGLLQADVARELDISTFRANRLIALAVEQGLVRTVVDGPIAGCVALEKQMKADYGLKFCRVVPDRNIDTFRALGAAVGACLNAVLDQDSHRIIGIGHGRTLASINQNMPARNSTAAEFVALLGALPSRISSYPFEAINHLTDRTGAFAHLIPAPLYADTPEDQAVFLRQTMTRAAFEKMRQTTLCLFGIGTVQDKPLTDIKMGVITSADLDSVRKAGGVAEILGCYYDDSGRKLDLALHRRVIAMPPEELAGRKAIAVAGGAEKVLAIRSILRSGLLFGLMTTESTVMSLLHFDTIARPRRRKRPERNSQVAVL